MTSTELEPPPTLAQSNPRAGGAFVFVWGIWALMLAALLIVAYVYTVNAPYADDWEAIPALVGRDPALRYLFEPLNEHITLVPKFIWLGLQWLSGWDFRAGVLFNILALGTLCAALQITTAHLRGSTAYSDAYFPFTLLSFGHFSNIFFGWQLQLITAAVLTSIVLIVIARTKSGLTRNETLVTCACLILLPFCGANGLLVIPALIPWLIYAMWRPGPMRAAPHRWGQILVLIALILASAAISFYLSVRSSEFSARPRPTFSVWFEYLGQVLTVSLGMTLGETAWPLFGLLVGVLMLSTVALLLSIWRIRPEERIRGAGLLCFMLAIVSIAAGIAWGRAGWHEAPGFVDRYFALTAPLMICIYLAWVIYGKAMLSTFLQFALFALACVPVLLDLNQCRNWLADVREQKRAFLRDAVNGTPLSILAARHAPAVYIVNNPNSTLVFADLVRLLGNAGHAPYDQVPDDIAGTLVITERIGSVDSIAADHIVGWAWDPRRPFGPTQVDVLDGDTLLISITANEYRDDLRRSGIGDGHHGFIVPTPAALRDGRSHTVRVRFAGTDQDLPGSPRSLRADKSP